MPELPEVETTRKGILPHLLNHTVTRVIVRNKNLRWPVPAGLNNKLKQQQIISIDRRAKYLLLQFKHGTLIIHLGMSGSLRILPCDSAVEKHDHFELQLDTQQCMRLRDPRRFGAVLWTTKDPMQHKLLIHLGPEPLTADFDPDHIYQQSRNRKTTIKQFIMDSKIVVGVGNIYASEALFLAGIHPKRPAGKISRPRFQALTRAIKNVLSQAIQQGGTTLKDFTASDGKPGYFKQQLNVYDRKGEPCNRCKKPVKQETIGQRSTYYCTSCQK